MQENRIRIRGHKLFDGKSVMAIHLHTDDLPDGLDLGSVVAVATETMGLNPFRDRLCLVQLSSGDGNAHLIRITDRHVLAPNLTRMLGNANQLKLFHFGRFDIAVLHNQFGVTPAPVFCTKIASKIARSYTDRHGLKELVRELIGMEISKEQQSSDWGLSNLSADQLQYAANDVLHLHRIHDKLRRMLVREHRLQHAEACFEYLPNLALLDLAGWHDQDIFSH